MSSSYDKDFNQTLDDLRALLGGSPVARSVIRSESELLSLTANSDYQPTKKSAVETLPRAFKTFKVADFMRLKKHKNDKTYHLIQKFVEKNGPIKEGSKELEVLVNTLTRLQVEAD